MLAEEEKKKPTMVINGGIKISRDPHAIRH